jgi:hypothetical protein
MGMYRVAVRQGHIKLKRLSAAGPDMRHREYSHRSPGASGNKQGAPIDPHYLKRCVLVPLKRQAPRGRGLVFVLAIR